MLGVQPAYLFNPIIYKSDKTTIDSNVTGLTANIIIKFPSNNVSTLVQWNSTSKNWELNTLNFTCSQATTTTC